MMGTRADFYMGRGESAVWLASIAWDGHPGGIDDAVLTAETGDDYLKALGEFCRGRDDVTLPEMGWPWPWDTSHTTDFAYAFDAGTVYASCFGHDWFIATDEMPADRSGAKVAEFPDMSDETKATFGPRSGLMIFGL